MNLNEHLDWAPVVPLLDPEACDPSACKVNCCRIGVFIPELGVNFASPYACRHLAGDRCTIYERRLEYEYCFALKDLLLAGDCTASCTCTAGTDLSALGYRGKEAPPPHLAAYVQHALFSAWQAQGGPPPNANDRAGSDYEEWSRQE